MQIYSQYYLEKKNISWYVYLCKYQKIFALKSVTNSFNLLCLKVACVYRCICVYVCIMCALLGVDSKKWHGLSKEEKKLKWKKSK